MKILLEGGANVDSMDSQRWTPLFWASFKGNTSALQLLLDRNANHLWQDVHRWTALHWAVSRGEEKAVRILPKHHFQYLRSRPRSSRQSKTLGDFNKDINLLNTETPMEVAAEAKDANLFNILLENQLTTGGKSFNTWWSSSHFDPPISNLWRFVNKAEAICGIESYISSTWHSHGEKTGDTLWKARLLHSAIKDQKLSVMQLLIVTGANVNYVNGRSALNAAAFTKDPKFTQLFLQNGADVSLRDCYGQTALHQAVLNGFEETIAALLEGGSDVNARRDNDISLYLPLRSKMVRSKMVDHQTPLMLACGYEVKSIDDRKVQNRIIDLLISYGADSSLQDGKARTGLHYAAMSGNIETVRKFIDLGSDVNIQDNDGVSVLHYAAGSCNIDLVRLVINRGAEIRSIDKYGRSAVHHLAAGDETGFALKDLKCIFNSIYSGADPSMLNAEYDGVEARGGRICSSTLARHTAISVAAEKKNWNLFKILLESNAALPEDFSGYLKNRRSFDRATIFSAAIEVGNHHFVEQLIAQGSDIEVLDEHGWKPLHHAVLYDTRL